MIYSNYFESSFLLDTETHLNEVVFVAINYSGLYSVNSTQLKSTISLMKKKKKKVK